MMMILLTSSDFDFDERSLANHRRARVRYRRRIGRTNETNDMATTALHPSVKWCEREDKVYLTIEVQDAQKVDVKIEETRFDFACETPEGRKYAETLDLFDKVKMDACTYATTGRQVFAVLVKETPKWWGKLLPSGTKKPANLKVDFDKWADEDDDDVGDVDTSGFDMQSMMAAMGGGAGGMPGMMPGMMGGGAGGMPGMMGGDMGGGMGGAGGPGGDPADMAKLQELIASMKSEEAAGAGGAKLEPVEEEGEEAGADDLPDIA